MIRITPFFLKFLSLIVILNSNIFLGYTQTPIIFSDIESEMKIGSYSAIFEDTLSNKTIDNVLGSPFILSSTDVLNLDVSKSTFWIKFKIENKTNVNNLLLHITNPMIDEITLYSVKNYNVEQQESITSSVPIYKRKYNHQDFIFDLDITSNTLSEFIIKVKSSKMIILPIRIGTSRIIDKNTRTKDLIFGIFFGIMLVMFLYNLFIYFTVRDSSYLYYVIYILIVTLTQLSFQGYTYKYIWPKNIWLINHSFFILSAMVGISAGEFIKYFLEIKKYSKYLYNGFYFFYALYVLGLVFMFSKSYQISHKLIDLTALSISFYILFAAFKIMRKGNRSAIFLLISWGVFLAGVTIFAMKNFGILPSNNFTEYTMPMGAAIETVLLSFALAARINDYKREKEESQKIAFIALEDKEKLVREHNVMLEQKVEERTIELNKTLNNLKETQSQLVDAEKMASLGQLTAGIAHEINNPINFVSSNISPLKQDIDDLKTIIEKYNEINTNNFDEKIKEVEALRSEL
ncbi:MAG: 7TM diverse intracellular signaling domain-containing protein, partial [Flavobacteriales bacterium]